MAEKRPRLARMLLSTDSKKRLLIEVYDADEWEHGNKGLYRVRVNGRWADPSSVQEFWTATGMATLLSEKFTGAVSGVEFPEPSNLSLGDEVRIRPLDRMPRKARVASNPILGIDGRWWVALAGERRLWALDELEVIP